MNWSIIMQNHAKESKLQNLKKNRCLGFKKSSLGLKKSITEVVDKIGETCLFLPCPLFIKTC